MLILLVVWAPVVVGWGVYHFRGYLNGRYDRWSEEDRPR